MQDGYQGKERKANVAMGSVSISGGGQPGLLTEAPTNAIGQDMVAVAKDVSMQEMTDRKLMGSECAGSISGFANIIAGWQCRYLNL